MKLILMTALMGLFSATAFADFQVYDTTQPENAFECRLHKKGKKGGHCRVWGELQGRPETTMSTERVRLSMHVKCNDGFELVDRNADVFYGITAKKFVIKGRKGGDESYLEIRGDETPEDNKFPARLLNVEGDNDADHYRGRCYVNIPVTQ